MSENAKHSAGPWTAIKASHGPIDIFDANDRDVVTVYGGGVPEDREANAQLIAASPTMFGYINKRAEAGDAEAVAIVEAINAAR